MLNDDFFPFIKQNNNKEIDRPYRNYYSLTVQTRQRTLNISIGLQ